MTEEEKKKQEQQATATQQPDAVEQSIRNMEGKAAQYREFAKSPVNIDTSGQPNWMQEIERVRREYTESPERQAAREQREKRNRRIAAISDGLVALSNVTGAMVGATPIKQTVTMSDAHRKAVERAATRRRENAARYETARRYLSGLQQQQDKLNADRYDKAVKARQDADKQADALEGTAARLRQNQSNSDRNYGLQKEKFEEQKEHNRKTLALQAERNSISRSKGGGSSEKKEDEAAAMKYWESLTDNEREEYRAMFNRDDGFKSDDKSFIDLVWERRKAYLRNHGRGDEISSGGYNRNYRNGKNFTRQGRKQQGRKSAI